MSQIQAAVAALRARGEAAFVPFLVIGDPDIQTSLQLTAALVEAGADVLEFGLPFSDPPADGPVIQAADVRALKAGMRTVQAFAFLDKVRRRHGRPMALLVYHNLILQYGVESFYASAAEAGVDAVLVADVPLEEAAPLVEAATRHRVCPVFIASALSTPERLARLAQLGRGFVYTVARLGVTGEQAGVSDQLQATLARVKAATDLPALAGFGIGDPQTARAAIAAGADGVICGSAIVRRIAEHLDDPPRMLREVRTFAAEMKAATRAATRGESDPC